MTAPGPQSCWQPYALALIAATCLAFAAAASAADSSKPTGSPLWEAYPLDNGSTAATPSAITPEPEAAPLPQLHAESGSASTPLQIAFFGCLGVALLALARAALARLARRPAGQLTCEIWWSASEEGGAFCATALERGDAPRLVAASPRFERRQPGPPDEDWASRQAYTQLVRELMSNGWEPYERGNAWWEMRLRRTEQSSVQKEAVHG
jgi:hypothetical protein